MELSGQLKEHLRFAPKFDEDVGTEAILVGFASKVRRHTGTGATLVRTAVSKYEQLAELCPIEY